jgi:hypothetical protein
VRAWVAAVGLVAALAAAGGAGTIVYSKTFRTPSKYIACAYYDSSITGRVVFRCDLLSVRPEPARRCEVDWTGASMSVRAEGPTCAGDTVNDPRAPLLVRQRVDTPSVAGRG